MSSERSSRSASAVTPVYGGRPDSLSRTTTRCGTAPFSTRSTVCCRFSPSAVALFEFTSSECVASNASVSADAPGAVTNPATTPTTSPRAT